MARSKLIPRCVATGFLLLLLLALWHALAPGPSGSPLASLHAQEAPAAGGAAAEFEFEGIARCAGCHEQPTAIYERLGATKFVRLDESKIWLEHDKHSKAVELIDPKNSPLAARMCEQLKIPDIHQAKQCLSCHANWQYDAQRQAWADRPKFHEFGVSCESCHGPASKWRGPHEEVAWRKLSPERKEREFGFVEVRNPVARAKQCLACHVGDPAQHKVVTHEMYAAGHPPLPGVELETFAAAMPPHWRHITTKLVDNAKKHGEENARFEFYDEFVAANPAATAGGDVHASRAALLSAVVAMQASLQLVGAQVEDEKHLPDFAVFDCYACHHDLKSPSWRQQRTNVGVPGRPRPAVWPTVLVEAAYAFADVDPAPFRAALETYQAAFDAQPFGHPAKFAPARAALEAELARLLTALAAATSDQAAVRRAFARLTAPVQTLDYDAARQTAWALRIMARDAGRPLPEAFAASLHLALPAGHGRKITEDLPARLKALSSYDPSQFHAELKALRP